MVALPVIPSLPAPRAAPRGWLSGALLRAYRAAVVVAIVYLIHRHHARLRVDGDSPIDLNEARAFFPTAAKFETDASERTGLFVNDARGRRVGYLLRTSPVADKIVGFAGPTDTLVAMDADMRVVGVRIRSSVDTKQHVRDVAEDRLFMKTWTGKTWDQVAGMDPKAAGIEGVSGASLTSLCIANGIRQRFLHSTQAAAAQPAWRFGFHDAALAAVVCLALLFSFTDLRGHAVGRRAFQVVLIGYVGFYNGQILAQSLFAGWAANGVPWRTAPALALLAAAALAVPWASRRAVYCSHLCPHGAAQEWAGRLTRRKWSPPRGLDRGLRWLPGLLIALVLVVTFHRLPTELASIEPFDAYLVRNAGVATISIALLGLAAAAFVPMAYCKYGCPTGLLLNFVRSHGRADHFGRRDFAAGLMVGFAVSLFYSYDAVHHWIFR